MEQQNRFKGYTNWETWQLSSELNNDPFLTSELGDIIQTCLEDGMDAYDTGGVVRKWVEDLVYQEEIPEFISRAAVEAFIQKIDWVEIAKTTGITMHVVKRKV